MEPFQFHNPTRIVFGPGVVEEAGEEAATIGSHALICTGKRSAEKSGLLDRVTRLMAEAGVEVFHLKGIDPNPRITSVAEGIRLCKANGVDLVVGLGGGSAMDAAKAVAAGVFWTGELWDMLSHGQPYEPPERALPIMMIPTLAATGSEMNRNAVITNLETTEKCAMYAPCVFPRVSLVDPSLTCTVPPLHTAYGAVDTIIHSLEPYLNGPDDVPLQDYMQEGIFLTAIEYAPRALADPNDVAVRGHLQWASILSLNHLNQAGCPGAFPLHSIEHVLSAYYDVVHAAGLAAISSAFMKHALPHRPDKYARFATRVFGVDAAGREAEDVAREGIERWVAFLKSIDCPTCLGDLGIGSDRLEEMLDTTLRNSGGPEGVINSRPPLDREGVKAVLELAL